MNRQVESRYRTILGVELLERRIFLSAGFPHSKYVPDRADPIFAEPASEVVVGAVMERKNSTFYWLDNNRDGVRTRGERFYVAWDNGRIVIQGTSGWDTVEIGKTRAGFRIEINSMVMRIDDPVETIELDMKSGYERIRARPTVTASLNIRAERGTITSGSGDDTIHLIDNSQSGHQNLVRGMGGNDSLVGGTAKDIMLGGPGNDTILGGRGMDQLAGNDGNDVILGGPQRDLLVGGNGDDVLVGGDNWDILIGRAGADTISGEGGYDAIRADHDDIIHLGEPEATWRGVLQDVVLLEGDPISNEFRKRSRGFRVKPLME